MILKHIKSVFAIDSLKKKIIATMLLILVYKLLSVIPLPGANTDGLKAIIEQQKGLSLFSALMGGGLSHFSIILMGLSPYINAVIIIQLLGVIVPKIGDMQKEGDSGQRKINKITRWLTLPLSFLQSYGMILLLNNLAKGEIIDMLNWKVVVLAMIIVTAGTLFLMWLGEIMTEYGIGNGISIIIMAGVLSGVPGVILNYFALKNYGVFAGILIATLFIIYVIIKFTEGNRRIPIIYTKTGREEKSYFPIRINQAGMIPIIFAISLVTFPGIVGQIMANSTAEKTQAIGTWLLKFFSMQNPSWVFILVYFVFVLIFSFFYVSITFNTEQVAESIQKRGGYIPGIRPGSETAEYLTRVSSHLNLFGGSFLALIAVLPYILEKLMPGQ
ncbi:MAG: preprotein translocase subunit SecY, partial [Candidatus Gracilibacteria bacterium]|nr:preprotein translocase subunit SecY [Candidatus Gracilibacteria bacterium]